jgi:hypothetical protein
MWDTIKGFIEENGGRLILLVVAAIYLRFAFSIDGPDMIGFGMILLFPVFGFLACRTFG